MPRKKSLARLSTVKSQKTRGGGWFVVYNAIPAVIAAVEANSIAAVKRKGDDVLKSAKSRIHRVTGELQDTAYVEVVSRGKEATINFPAEHAAPVEYGTYKMAPRPYLYPSIMEHTDDFFNAVGKGGFVGLPKGEVG